MLLLFGNGGISQIATGSIKTFFYSPNVTVELKFPLLMRKVPRSTAGSEANYSARGIFRFSSVPPSKCSDNT
jgi:hypothetical protein